MLAHLKPALSSLGFQLLDDSHHLRVWFSDLDIRWHQVDMLHHDFGRKLDVLAFRVDEIFP